MEVIVPIDAIERKIYLIRGHKVMLDSDLAELYGILTKGLVQAVKRNLKRFPSDFMLQLTNQEVANLRSQIVTSSWGGRRHLPYVFSEQGVAMLSSVLNSERAVQVNIILISTVRPNLKHFVFIKKARPNHVASTGFAVISPSEKVESRYLYYYLTSDTFTDYLTRVADGGAYPAFNPEELRNAEIPLPLSPNKRPSPRSSVHWMIRSS